MVVRAYTLVMAVVTAAVVLVTAEVGLGLSQILLHCFVGVILL